MFLLLCGQKPQFTIKWKITRPGHTISCPVVAIHSEYDPHPAAGVEKPLSTLLDEFHFILLTRCGHRHWIERYAKEKFYRLLKNELKKVYNQSL
jgi:hypothetical protein